MKTYISLFSSAGIGCYGFKMENFECVATNELIQRRLEIQKINKKCKYESGYICGDITLENVKSQVFDEIDKWKKQEKIDGIDVVIATPPCQGMSVANLKKNNEINRNSLVVESLGIIDQIKPKIFILENVSSFLNTACIDKDNEVKTIEDAIICNLDKDYNIVSKVINFKDYGSNSSRTRTLVIGTRIDLEYISPIDLFPKRQTEKTLREVIGSLETLEYGQVSSKDIYHFARGYPEHMISWISDLKEGQSAFDQEDDLKKPHTIVDGKIKINVNKTGDKYKRQYWDKVAPCIHTRNDQLASQNTIHPQDNRVFSIRELMRLMTIPDSFKWSIIDEVELNNLNLLEKKQFLKKNEINIRQSIGEAVPTNIFAQIAKNINTNFEKQNYSKANIKKIIKQNNLEEFGNLIEYLKQNKQKLSFETLSKIAEYSNAKRNKQEAYYTNKSLLNNIYTEMPQLNKSKIHILEPSVGVGNFLPYLIDKYSYAQELIIDVVDINLESLEILKELLDIIDIPKNVKINYINHDFLTYDFDTRYDLTIGNPPFMKLNSKNQMLKLYRKNCINDKSTNTASYFLEKAIKLSDNVIMIMPKFLLNTDEYEKTRKYIEKMNIKSIIDFGEKGFDGVLIETICINVNTNKKPTKTKIFSLTKKLKMIQNQKYITDNKLPYWVIYRNKQFDSLFEKMEFDIFNVFRDRQITNSNSSKTKKDIWILKARNINDDATKINHIENYDAYIQKDKASSYKVFEYLDKDNLYLTPNMTYKPRVCKKPKGTIVNGSVAILIPKNNEVLSNKNMLFFSSKEYRTFYMIARNFQTRSLNIDKTSVFFFGKLKEEKN